MKTHVIAILIAAATSAGSAALAQQPQYLPPDDPFPDQAPQGIPEPPPPPPQADSPAQQAGYVVAQAAPVEAPPATGQWVFTQQYGWVWMPYGPNYTYVDASNAAYTWSYYPSFGWRWLSSPWVVGAGPAPYWGRLGPSHFAWYGHPGFRGYGGRPCASAHFGVQVAPRLGWTGRPVFAPPAHAWWRGGGHYGGWHHR